MKFDGLSRKEIGAKTDEILEAAKLEGRVLTNDEVEDIRSLMKLHDSKKDGLK